MKLPNVRPTVVDRVVSYFNPERGAERLRARATMALYGQWTGGRTDRRQTATWLPPTGSADADNLGDLPNLRARSRDLQRSSPIGAGAVNTNVTSIAGTGMALRSRIDAEILGLDKEAAQEWQEGVEREFRTWAENPIACDAEGSLSFYLLQPLALRSALESGDVFALLPYEARAVSPYRLKIQLIEADRVCNPEGKLDSDTIAGGVEKDRLGMPVRYHIMRGHPFSVGLARSRVWDAVPAFGSRTQRRNVVHLFDKRRPGQSRGVPYLSPVLESIRQISNYTDAELQAAVVSAFFTVFVKSNSGGGLGLDDTGAAPTSAQGSGSGVKLGAGAIIDLAEGEDIVTADPNRPNVAFEGFVKAMAWQIGIALELPADVLTKQFTASYSAARASLLEAWRFFKVRRAWLAEMFCQPIFDAWLDEAVALGRIDAPGYFDDPVLRAAYRGAEWVGDGPGQIDPLKEIEAAKARIDAGLSTHQRETAELTGANWSDENDTLGRELEEKREAGTMPPDPAARGPQFGNRQVNPMDPADMNDNGDTDK